MKARRLGEVLDECLSAYFEGRRSVEDSLSLYPALRDELEPLLRTAIHIAETFNESSPPQRVEERGHEEFLTSASVRQRARILTKDVSLGRRLAGAAGRRRWLLLAAAFAIGISLAAAGAAGLGPSSDGGGSSLAPLTASPRQPTVSELRDRQQQLWRRANQGVDVSPEMIRSLASSTTALQSQIENFSALDSGSRLELGRAIADQYLLLHLIANTQPADVAPAARQALGVTRQVAQSWGVDLPEVPPGAQVDQTATPVGTPAATAIPASPLVSIDAPTDPAEITTPDASSSPE